MKVQAEITVHELDGDDGPNLQPLRLRGHFAIRDFIVLAFNDSEITVSSDELYRAIEACRKQNS